MSEGKKRETLDVSKQDIKQYWQEKGLKIKPEWDNAITSCWTCGRKATLERCHIIPDVLNGKPEPCNLVLMCPKCHSQNPETVYEEDFMKWFNARIERGIIECSVTHLRTLMKRKIFPDMLDEYENIYGKHQLEDIPFHYFIEKYFGNENFDTIFRFYMKNMKNSKSFFLRTESTRAIVFHKFKKFMFDLMISIDEKHDHENDVSDDSDDDLKKEANKERNLDSLCSILGKTREEFDNLKTSVSDDDE